MEEHQEHSLGGRVFQRIREDILKGKYKQNDELKEATLGKSLESAELRSEKHFVSWNWRDWFQSCRTEELMLMASRKRYLGYLLYEVYIRGALCKMGCGEYHRGTD